MTIIGTEQKFQSCPKNTFSSRCCQLVSFRVGIFCCVLNKTTWKASNLLSGAARRESGRPERPPRHHLKKHPKKKLVLRGAASSPVEMLPAPHQSPVLGKTSLSAPLAAGTLIIGEKTENGSDITSPRHSLGFVRCLGALWRRKLHGGFYLFSFSWLLHILSLWETSGQFEWKDIIAWPLTYWMVLRKIRKIGLFLHILSFFFSC